MSDIDIFAEEVRALAPFSASHFSDSALRRIIADVVEEPGRLVGEVSTKADRTNPNFPLYQYVADIAAYSAAVVAVYKTMKGAGDFIDFVVDNNRKLQAVEQVISTLKKLGLTDTAQFAESLVDKVLDRMTKAVKPADDTPSQRQS